MSSKPRSLVTLRSPVPRLRTWTTRWVGLLATVAVLLATATAAPAAEAPDFRLKDLDGKWFRLSDHTSSRVVYVTFWATWCAPCRRELPELQKLSNELGPDRFLVVAVNTDPPAAHSQVASWVKQRKLTYPSLLDPDNRVLDLFNPSRNLPFGVLLDRGGRVVDTTSGYRAGEETMLKEKVLQLLAGTGPDEGAAGP